MDEPIITADCIKFFVPGLAKTSGSKRAFKNPKTDKIIVTAANPKQKKWQDACKWMAMQLCGRMIPWDGPLILSMVFIRQRPRNHFGTGRNEGVMKDWAGSLMPTSKPDSLKLGRAVEDALKGIIYNDDSQICRHVIDKKFGANPGVEVTIAKYK